MAIRNGQDARPSLTGHGIDAGRRRFVLGAAATGLAAGLSRWRPAEAATTGRGLTHLSGTEFDLTIDWLPVDITGRRRRAIAINGSLPAPVLHWREGDTVTMRVKNNLAEQGSIHWHGIVLPNDMDGVPGFNYPGIDPGVTFTYRFPIRQSGTYWYHSHSSFQEQLGLYGPLVIHPRDPAPAAYDREHVVMLSDWTDEDPTRVFHKLKEEPDYYNFHQPTVGDLWRDIRTTGLRQAIDKRLMWGGMRMNRTDLSDVSGYTYTYLVNGRTPAENWTADFRPGERVLLRFVNAGSMTFFDVRIPGLKMTVIAADGQPVKPVTVDEFRISSAENFDVLVTPDANTAYTIFAQSMDRTGFARATLAPRAGMAAAVPAMDPRQELTMADMGHGMAAGAATGMAPGMVMEPGMDHSGHDMSAMPAAVKVTHAPTEYSPMVDMLAMNPVARLDDPGIGLRDNGRRVLTYADLDSTFPDPDGREPVHTVELHLTGNMERYVWSFNGVRASDAEPIRLKYGERVRFVLVNDGMMTHPIHLHGMWSDLEDEHGRFKVRKHTVSVKPGERLTYRVTADALGRWAYHCHLFMHMGVGMFREVRVDV